MAAIHKGSRTLNGKARQQLLTAAACVVMLLAYMAVFFESLIHFDGWHYYLLPVLWIFGIFYYRRSYKIYKSGAAGEDGLLAELKKLPNSYHVFTNYRIEEKRIRDEIDFVVVGKNGVFIIEVKNHVGKITGGADDVEWQQEKLGKHGAPQKKAMRNPVKQAKWHNANVSRLLYRNGIKLPTRVMLVFTNPNVSLDIETDGIPVLTESAAAVNYILSKNGGNRLDADKVNKISEWLLEYEKKL